MATRSHIYHHVASCIIICATLLAPLSTAQLPKPAPQTARQMCQPGPGFDPASYVRIYEDSGKHRIPMYTPTPGCAASRILNSRLLKADPESTIILDLSEILASDTGSDVALNKLFVKAELKSGDASRGVEVVGYSQIGQAESDKASQIAFAFQTFDNIGGKLVNLYFTTRDIIDRVYQPDTCYAALSQGESSAAQTKAACELTDANRAAALTSFETSLKTFAPEITELAKFFSSSENQTINEKLATDIFEVDIESLRAIATQVNTELSKLNSEGLTDAARISALELLLERTKLTVQDMSGLIRATRSIVCNVDPSGTPCSSLAYKGDLSQVCPNANAKRLRLGAIQDTREFARTCVTELKRKEYVKALKEYLIEGTINLAKNAAANGDVLTITIEAKGPDQDAPGAQAEFRVRLTNYGWKSAVEPSLFFIKRIGVNEADGNRAAGDPVKSLEPVRFAPFPGINFTASYHGNRGTNAFMHYLAPGFGINATFMTFGAHRDFDPLANDGKGQFTTVNGSNFEIGTGPVVTLFGNRISATYGWNLMAGDRRTYFGFGFGFLSLGHDLIGLIKKN